MPIPRLDTVCLLRPEEVPPSHESLQVISAFNPGVVDLDNRIGLLVRIAETPVETRPGFVGLPRYEPGRSEPVIDWLPETAIERIDPRVVRLKENGTIRLTFVSHLRWVLLDSTGKRVEQIDLQPTFYPQTDWETYGVEDPRITALDGQSYFTYVAVSPHGAGTALASTSDFRTFTRYGVLFPPENKDVLLFPERVQGRYVALHRPNPNTHFHPPEMWIAYSYDLLHWGEHRPLYGGRRAWENDRVGGSTVPIRIPQGWLEVYHSNQKARGESGVGTYTASAMLLDPDDPARVLAVSEEPILVPEADFERVGFVPNVVFPTGLVVRGDRVLLYYGAADTCTAVAELSLEAIVESLRAV